MSDIVKVGQNELTPVDSPNRAIIQMLEHGLDTDKIEKMLELQERWEANEARKSFYADMAMAQSEMPTVVEDKFNDQTKSNYSSYKALAAACKPVYTKHGLSLIFYETDCPKEDHTRTVVDVAHRMGHKETFHVDVPNDISGIAGKVNKTKTHAKGSSFSYGRSYLMKLVFNLPTGDDDDGNGAGAPLEHITDEQAIQLQEMAEATKGGIKKFEGYLQTFNPPIESIETIPAKAFDGIFKVLKDAQK